MPLALTIAIMPALTTADRSRPPSVTATVTKHRDFPRGTARAVLDMRRAEKKEPWVLRLMFSEREIASNPPGGAVTGPCHMSGGWHHVVGTWANGTARLYVDGKLIAEQGGQQGTITDAMLADCPAFLGRQVVGFYGPRPKREPRGFVGAIDEFLVLRRALPAEEVRQLFDGAPAR